VDTGANPADGAWSDGSGSDTGRGETTETGTWRTAHKTQRK